MTCAGHGLRRNFLVYIVEVPIFGMAKIPTVCRGRGRCVSQAPRLQDPITFKSTATSQICLIRGP